MPPGGSGGAGGYVALTGPVLAPDPRRSGQQLRDGVQEPLPVGQYGPVDRVGRVGILGHGVEEGAAAETGGPDPVDDRPRDGPDLPAADALPARAAATCARIP